MQLTITCLSLHILFHKTRPYCWYTGHRSDATQQCGREILNTIFGHLTRSITELQVVFYGV